MWATQHWWQFLLWSHFDIGVQDWFLAVLSSISLCTAANSSKRWQYFTWRSLKIHLRQSVGIDLRASTSLAFSFVIFLAIVSLARVIPKRVSGCRVIEQEPARPVVFFKQSSLMARNLAWIENGLTRFVLYCFQDLFHLIWESIINVITLRWCDML